MVVCYTCCSNLQVQVVDTDLIRTTNSILSQFQAQVQTAALQESAKAAESDDPSSAAPMDTSPATFVDHFNDDSPETPSLGNAVFVRLANKDGASVAVAPADKQFPGIIEALRKMRKQGPGMCFDFAGGDKLPVLRVETSDLGPYRLQVGLSWQQQQMWLLALREWLAAIAVAATFLAGCGGYGVARRSIASIEIIPVVHPQVIQETETQVRRRTLVEQKTAAEEPATIQQESPDKTIVHRVTVEEEPEQQIVGRTPPDI